MTIAIVISITNILCFIIGAKIGQTVYQGKDIRFPNLNITEIKRRNREKKHAVERLEVADRILSNIEKYDGTSRGQEDI